MQSCKHIKDTSSPTPKDIFAQLQPQTRRIDEIFPWSLNVKSDKPPNVFETMQPSNNIADLFSCSWKFTTNTDFVRKIARKRKEPAIKQLPCANWNKIATDVIPAEIQTTSMNGDTPAGKSGDCHVIDFNIIADCKKYQADIKNVPCNKNTKKLNQLGRMANIKKIPQALYKLKNGDVASNEIPDVCTTDFTSKCDFLTSTQIANGETTKKNAHKKRSIGANKREGGIKKNLRKRNILQRSKLNNDAVQTQLKQVMAIYLRKDSKEALRVATKTSDSTDAKKSDKATKLTPSQNNAVDPLTFSVPDQANKKETITTGKNVQKNNLKKSVKSPKIALASQCNKEKSKNNKGKLRQSPVAFRTRSKRHSSEKMNNTVVNKGEISEVCTTDFALKYDFLTSTQIANSVEKNLLNMPPINTIQTIAVNTKVQAIKSGRVTKKTCKGATKRTIKNTPETSHYIEPNIIIYTPENIDSEDAEEASESTPFQNNVVHGIQSSTELISSVADRKIHIEDETNRKTKKIRKNAQKNKSPFRTRDEIDTIPRTKDNINEIQIFDDNSTNKKTTSKKHNAKTKLKQELKAVAAVKSQSKGTKKCIKNPEAGLRRPSKVKPKPKKSIVVQADNLNNRKPTSVVMTTRRQVKKDKLILSPIKTRKNERENKINRTFSNFLVIEDHITRKYSMLHQQQSSKQNIKMEDSLPESP